MIESASGKVSLQPWISGSALRLLRVALFAPLLVTLAARVAFPLPFTPIPFTLQPLAVLGVGLALGPWEGALAMLAYLAEGALGAPVFSPTGPGGLVQLLGSTGGFLLAYPAVAFISGGMTRRLEGKVRPFPAALIGCMSATALLFLVGACWFGVEARLGWRTSITAGVLPFIPGELVKVLAAAGTYRALKGTSSSFGLR